MQSLPKRKECGLSSSKGHQAQVAVSAYQRVKGDSSSSNVVPIGNGLPILILLELNCIFLTKDTIIIEEL